jgi:hypothetical protein
MDGDAGVSARGAVIVAAPHRPSRILCKTLPFLSMGEARKEL